LVVVVVVVVFGVEERAGGGGGVEGGSRSAGWSYIRTHAHARLRGRGYRTPKDFPRERLKKKARMSLTLSLGTLNPRLNPSQMSVALYRMTTSRPVMREPQLSQHPPMSALRVPNIEGP
jgi:hypothetical protein